MHKKNKILKNVIITLSVLLVVVTAALVINKINLNEVRDIANQYKEEILANQQTVYVASSDIVAGENILAGINVEKQKIYTGLEYEYYMTEEDLGSIAIIDIQAQTPIMSAMVTPLTISPDMREFELQVVNLMVDQKEDDYIDVRIQFPNGMDQIVLTKKQVKNLNMENQVFWTYLNEEEILRLSSAIIDAYSITGTKIYADRYVESNLQKEAEPTYLVNPAVMDMFDPQSAYFDANLLTKATQTLNAIARTNMEQKLGTLSEEKLAAIAAGHELEDTARNSVLVGASQYDYEGENEAISSGTNATTTPSYDDEIMLEDNSVSE